MTALEGVQKKKHDHRAGSPKEGTWHEKFRAEHRRTRGQSTEEGKGPEITLGKRDDRREHREGNRPGESTKEGMGKENRARKSKRDRRESGANNNQHCAEEGK
jgi:hypothetical protein